MELKISRNNIHIVPSDDLDIAFFEDTIGLSEHNSATMAIRLDLASGLNQTMPTIKIMNAQEVLEQRQASAQENRTKQCPQCFGDIDMIEDEFMISHLIPDNEFFLHPACYRHFKKKLENMVKRGAEEVIDGEIEADENI
jgi:hypothetical protein